MKAIILTTIAALSLTFCFVERSEVGMWFFGAFLFLMVVCSVWGFLKGRD
ncbi:MAG: hypothetical protein IPM37_23250 [Hahellaceae bacterium]|nr:hypothetical protein [Hahellaceae bacterium]